MMPESFGGKVGCGCVSVILLFWVVIPMISSCCSMVGDKIKDVSADIEARKELRVAAQREKDDAERAAADAAAREASRQAESAARAQASADREDRLRTFAIKEASTLWQTYQALGAQIVDQGKRIEELRKTLIEFDKDPDSDSDYKAICVQRDAMITARESLHKKLEDAYLAYRKFEATPSRKDYDELRRLVLEDGIREADEAAKRFTVMRKEK